MSWNYRIMRRKSEADEYEYGIYEVFYNEAGEVKGYTENSLTPVCDSAEGLFEEMQIMFKAFENETLDYRD